MIDQKNASPDHKDPSPALDAERRRRMREAAAGCGAEEWSAVESAGDGYVVRLPSREPVASYAEIKTFGQREVPMFITAERARHIAAANPSAVLALLDALEQAERERDALRERLAAAERRVAELDERDNDRRNDAWKESERG